MSDKQRDLMAEQLKVIVWPVSKKQVLTVQVAGLVMLGGGSLLAGLLPLCLRGVTARLSSGPGLSYLACYGGGVILATCFTHMMPEVRIEAEWSPLIGRGSTRLVSHWSRAS